MTSDPPESAPHPPDKDICSRNAFAEGRGGLEPDLEALSREGSQELRIGDRPRKPDLRYSGWHRGDRIGKPANLLVCPRPGRGPRCQSVGGRPARRSSSSLRERRAAPIGVDRRLKGGAGPSLERLWDCEFGSPSKIPEAGREGPVALLHLGLRDHPVEGNHPPLGAVLPDLVPDKVRYGP